MAVILPKGVTEPGHVDWKAFYAGRYKKAIPKYTQCVAQEEDAFPDEYVGHSGYVLEVDGDEIFVRIYRFKMNPTGERVFDNIFAGWVSVFSVSYADRDNTKIELD